MKTELSPKKSGDEKASGAAEKTGAAKIHPIEICRKYKFEIAVLAAAVVCVVSMAAAAVIIFRDDDADAVPRGEEKQIVTRVGRGNRFDTGAGEDTEISLSWYSKTIYLDGIEAYDKISAEVYPLGTRDDKITWRSSNETIAKVDGYGNITAYAPGEVIIEASNSAGETKDAELKIIRPVTGVFLPTTEITLYEGGSPRLLQAWLSPEDASVDDLTWTSKDPSVAEVDSMGRVKPVSAGMTEIIAGSASNDVQSKCFVTVVNRTVNVEEVAIQNKENNIIEQGGSVTTVATVTPDSAKNKTLRWTSSDENVAVVNGNGTVQALSAGTTTITAEAANGVSDSIDIQVTAANGGGIDLGNNFLEGFSMMGDLPIGAPESGIIYTPYDLTIDDMVNIQMGSNPVPQIWVSGGSVDASEEETREYLDPNSFYTDAYKYQFLDLSRSNGISEEALNDFLADKGILSGMAETFISAAREFGISEVYLAAHACLESGNGTSQLATGMEVNGETVYNMFGIAAYDSSALYSGSMYAYNAGWTSPEAAIRGGAEWISTWYINNVDARQNTLYKMRWNPENPSEHQYATDIGWAVKQAMSIERMFASFPEAELTFDVPVYSGMIPPLIE